MTPRMFQDLVVSSVTRPSRGRGRALPLSLAVHGLAFTAIAALPLLRAPELVEAAQPKWNERMTVPTAVVVQPPEPVRVEPPRAARRETVRDTRPLARTADTGGPPAALPMDVSRLGTGDPDPDAPPPCLYDCAAAAETSGSVVGTGLPADGDGTGTGTDPAVPRRAGIDVQPPVRTGGAAPVYPDLARAARTEGRVVIECTIDPSGRVVNAVITRGHPLFDAAALDAVRTWTYRPTLVGGVPVAVLMTVTVNFTLAR